MNEGGSSNGVGTTMAPTRRQLLLSTLSGLAMLTTARINALALASEETGLKDHLKTDFLFGTAINNRLIRTFEPALQNLVAREFSAITMTNGMKWERIQPQSGQWEWDIADAFMAFGEQHGMHLVGHTLVWHSQMPKWVYKQQRGRPISRSALLHRMKHHIETLVGRYQGRIHTWDVVNEAFDGGGWRKSEWFNTIGPSYVDHAFQFAHEVDRNAHLIYNDYNMHDPKKRAFTVDYLKHCRRHKVPLHGVGMQGHVALGHPDIAEFEKSIIAYAAEGVRVHITEMEVDVLPSAWDHVGADISKDFEYASTLDPYTTGLPQEIQKQLTRTYVDYFKLFLKHRDKIDRVTLWGIGDADSWKNNFPVKGRTNYPLLFDRQYNKKPAYDAIVALKR